jgi:hypothetical protein
MDPYYIITALILLFALLRLFGLTHIIDRIRYSRKTELKSIYIEILRKHHTYYQHLIDDEKKRFERRVRFILDTTTISAAENLELTPEMQVITAAWIAQLHFGISPFPFRRVHKVVLTRDRIRFNNEIKLKGYYSTQGYVVLTWYDLLEGHINNSDGKNLALHECAHALHHAFERNEYPYENTQALISWNQLMHSKISEVKCGAYRSLRAYGGNNMAELFSVCVESFFECPQLLYEEMPKAYKLMTRILNQNPINASSPVITKVR